MIYQSEFSYQHPKLDNIIHVFDKDWHGIRNAASYSPGHKFLISHKLKEVQSSLDALSQLINRNNSNAIFFHGFSPVAEMFAIELKKVKKDLTLYFVGHVNSTQFIHEFEVDMINRAISLKKQNIFKKLFSVKPNFNLVSHEFENQTLFNFPPNIKHFSKDRNNLLSSFVFIPLEHGDWRKNVDTNIIISKALNLDVITIRAPRYLVAQSTSKILETGFLDQKVLFNYFRDTKFSLSISISECQPMTQLEALANGSDIFTGPLNLEPSGTDYEKWFEIKSPDNLLEIQTKLKRRLNEGSPSKLREQYLKKRINWAIESYLEAIT